MLWSRIYVFKIYRINTAPLVFVVSFQSLLQGYSKVYLKQRLHVSHLVSSNNYFNVTQMEEGFDIEPSDDSADEDDDDNLEDNDMSSDNDELRAVKFPSSTVISKAETTSEPPVKQETNSQPDAKPVVADNKPLEQTLPMGML